MFTLEQINTVHDHFGNIKTLVDYLKALQAIGVQKYDSYLKDGHSEYFGLGGYVIASPPTHDEYVVAPVNNREDFLEHLKRHQKGETNYFQMSKGLAGSGIEKWTFDTHEMTLTYYDKTGNVVLTESVAH